MTDLLILFRDSNTYYLKEKERERERERVKSVAFFLVGRINLPVVNSFPVVPCPPLLPNNNIIIIIIIIIHLFPIALVVLGLFCLCCEKNGDLAITTALMYRQVTVGTC